MANNLSKHWYAVYTKPRWEKKVNQLFRMNGIETYCPVSRIKKKWSDRTKVVEEPLFKSYVFVRITLDQYQFIRGVDGVVNFVYWCGKPALIPDEEIVTIRKFLNEHDAVEVFSYELKPGMEAVVQQGLFMDTRGIVVRVLHKKVEMRLERLGLVLVAQIDKTNVTPLMR